MRGKSYLQLRETTFDLYTEQERLPWYYKFLSYLSAWLVLAGYIMFSIAYTSSPEELHLPPRFVVGLSLTGVFVGYFSDATLAFLSRSLIFTFDGVLMPVLTASAVGVFSTIVHRALKDAPKENQIYLWIPLIVSSIATVISGVLSWVVYRKLRGIKDLDSRRRAHIPMDSFASPMLPKGTRVPREVHDMVPDDEQQRRQLMHLLMAKDKSRNTNAEDPSSNTYRIELPWEETGATATRTRSGSVPSQSSSGRFTIPGLTFGRERSSTNESFKDPRVVRREQIERSGLMQGQSQPNSAGLSPAWPTYGYSPPSQHQQPQQIARYV